jgi:5-methylcytosine-specific restriction endonuclease McrA
MMLENTSLTTMTPFLRNRTQVIYGNQQKRSKKFDGRALPYSLNQFRMTVVMPWVNDPRCVYCGLIVISESTFQVDHVIPLTRGGSWELSNLLLCCAECNTIKGCLTRTEYLALRLLVQDWNPYAAQDLYRRLKIGANPLAGRLLAG